MSTLSLKCDDEINLCGFIYGHKPIAYGISLKQPRKEILYKCSNCNTEIFNITNNKHSFCDKCGIKLNWNVIKLLNDSFTNEDEFLLDELLKVINQNNKMHS